MLLLVYHRSSMVHGMCFAPAGHWNVPQSSKVLVNQMEGIELLMPFLIPEEAGGGRAPLRGYTWMKQEECGFQTLEAKAPPGKTSPEAS